jgi:hypothetical protein
MKQIQVCQLNEQNYFVDITFADESPLEPNVYLIPADCVVTEPPVLKSNENAKWVNDAWMYEEIPVPPPKPAPEPFPEPTWQDKRLWAYQEESDPIFFKWQRDEATKQEWLDKIEEIQLRYPKPI